MGRRGPVMGRNLRGNSGQINNHHDLSAQLLSPVLPKTKRKYERISPLQVWSLTLTAEARPSSWSMSELWVAL
ncbi:uncharacterized protein LY79DRAFT_557761 [Colletotrichum navitas]|uniref:Uncharacterized protein n=1 Tax=Colletotrichum navitas TaxID=681940 RepID=A0AAD8V4D1_9PEZI|nr:uncharacterized protein LY79DRAFT_557761 [Colletotrichum navitas]KAK1585775.1 hypothetical protein LY79DRAFT_557761 [Colletotrichum navitas]